VSLRARHRPLLLLVLPAAVFLAFGLATLGDYGMTWDEAESWNAGASNLEMLRGTGQPWAATHVLPGYYFAIDTARALFADTVANALADGPGSTIETRDADRRILGNHAFNLLLATCSIALLCALVQQLSGRPRMAAYAGGALALMPPFVGHAQNNPKDLPALFAFLLAGWCIAGLARAKSNPAGGHAWRWVAGGALALGLALTTRALCISLIPIFGGWMLWRRRDALATRPVHWVALVLGSGAVAFALWPWLWDAPLAKVSEVFDRISIHALVDFQIVYLGDLGSWAEMPWHYRPVHLLVSLPLVHLGLAALCIFAAARWRAARDPRLDALLLACLWLGTLAIADQLAPYRYDGIRHFLPALPAVAILVAAGAEWLSDIVAQRVAGIASASARAAAANAPLALCGAVAALQIASTHPHQSAFMNVAANAFAGQHSEEWLELEYWGQAYKDGGRWIDANTERDALVYLPIGDKLARYYVRRPLGVWRQFEARFARKAQPQYVMFITRVGFYDDAIHRLEREYEPVYSLRVQNATLLKIYSNRAKRRDTADTGRG